MAAANLPKEVGTRHDAETRRGGDDRVRIDVGRGTCPLGMSRFTVPGAGLMPGLADGRRAAGAGR